MTTKSSPCADARTVGLIGRLILDRRAHHSTRKDCRYPESCQTVKLIAEAEAWLDE